MVAKPAGLALQAVRKRLFWQIQVCVWAQFRACPFALSGALRDNHSRKLCFVGSWVISLWEMD